MKLKLSGVVEESITDGRGIRYTVFTQGCPHHCKDCHNPQTWSFEGGEERDVKEIYRDFIKNPLLRGITFSGGEPFCQPEPLYELACLVHRGGMDVTVYSGYTYEQLLEMRDSAVNRLLDETDLLVDGLFIEEQKNLELHFRGSENQRLIDMNKTRQNGAVTLLEL